MPLTKLKGWPNQDRALILVSFKYCERLCYDVLSPIRIMICQDRPWTLHRVYRLTSKSLIWNLAHSNDTLTLKRIQAKSKLNPSLIYRFRCPLTMPLIGFVILMLDMELAMAVKWLIRRGSSSAAAVPLAGPPAPGTGAFRSRRRQLTQIPIK